MSLVERLLVWEPLVYCSPVAVAASDAFSEVERPEVEGTAHELPKVSLKALLCSFVGYHAIDGISA